MLSANAVVLGLLLSAGSSTYRHSATTHAHLASSNAAAVTNRTLSSFVATYDGEVAGLNWTQVVAGVDGIGAGNNVFRVAILVDEVDVCHIDVACDALAPDDYVATCTSTAFVVGQDIDVRITSMPCLGAPSGFHTTDLIQR